MAIAACGSLPVRAQQSAPSAAPAPSSAQWVIPHLQLGYTPPAGYRIKSKDARDEAEFIGPRTNGIPADITIVTVDLKGHSLEATVKHILDSLKERHPELTVSGVRPSRVGVDESFQADFRDTQKLGSGAPEDGETRLVMVTHEDRTYSLYLYADPAAFDRETAAFEKSLETVKWAVHTPAEPLVRPDLGLTATIPENWCLAPVMPDADSTYALVLNGPFVSGYRSNITLLLTEAGSAYLPPNAAEKLAEVRRVPEHYRMLRQEPTLVDRFPAVVIDGELENPDTHKPERDRVVLLVRHGMMHIFRLTTSAAGFDAGAREALASFMTSIHLSVQGGPVAPAAQ